MGLQLPDPELSALTARQGRLLIERLDPGALARHVVIPDQYRKSRVSASAVIRRVGVGCPSWCKVGAQVILSPTYGKKLYLGARDEVAWESIPPSFVQGVICASTEVETARSPEDPFRDILPSDRPMLTEHPPDEEGH